MAYSSSRRALSSRGGSGWGPTPLSFTDPGSSRDATSDREYNFAEGSSYTDSKKLQSSGSMKLVARSFMAFFFPRFRKVRHHPPRLGYPGMRYNNHQRVDDISLSRGSKDGSANWQVSICKQEDSSDAGKSRFSYSEIAAATGNFSYKNQIGQGGFGVVYKGVLKDGTVVAVKRGKKSRQDSHLSTEFTSEIKALSSVEHLNLVRFFGYLESPTEWIVIVEYVANGNLREHLDGTRGQGLELAARLDIAIDVAHALSYLHMYSDHPIIHRDIKPSNILLTENLRAKVTDFGFARFTSNDPEKTHISTQIKGTAGYMDPEYVKTYQLTEKSDVFSFGVLLIELMTGRRPIERERKERLTIRWAMKKLRDGEAFSVMDPRLMKNTASIVAVEKVLELASKCVMAVRRELRPIMAECAEILWSIRKTYRESQSPRFIYASSAAPTTPTTDFSRRKPTSHCT